MRTDLRSQAAGAIIDLPWDPAALAGPNAPHLDHPLLVRPESPIWTLRILMHHLHHKILGQGRWVWADEGGIHQVKPLRVGSVAGDWWWQLRMPGRKKGPAPPPSDKEVKMLELARFNVFTPDIKKGGARKSQFIYMCRRAMGLGGMECVGGRGSGPQRGQRSW